MSLVCRVNVKTKEITKEVLSDDYKLFGGRGLIAKVMNSEVDPACEPLGPDNKLIICTSLLAGTNVPMAHRLSVGGKSPLTRGIKEANVGGTAANMLAGHNIKMLIFEELPSDDDWYLLLIKKDGTISLELADGYIGLNNYDFAQRIKDNYGNDISIISIGTAGEREYLNSTLQVLDASTGYPSRAAARGGLGAVMGKKRIKAVVIEKSVHRHSFSYIDKERFERARKLFVERTLKSPRAANMKKIGTISMLDFTSTTAILPVRNFSGQFFEKAESINSAAFLERVKLGGGRNGEGCTPGCIVQCSNRFHNEAGEYLTSGLEYETVALCGSNCGISDLDTIIQLDRLCDDIGLDTIETGATIAICMEAGKIAWDDQSGAISLVEEMRNGSEFGSLLGQGTEAVGKALGVKRIPTVKGQALPAYDPRNLKGTGVTYSTSPMGADHTAGLTVSPGLDHQSKDGQLDASFQSQRRAACNDNYICSFGASEIYAEDVVPEWMAAMYGGEWDLEKVLSIGLETIRLEKEFNRAAGLTENDDQLPEFMYTEKSATGTVFDITAEELKTTFNF